MTRVLFVMEEEDRVAVGKHLSLECSNTSIPISLSLSLSLSLPLFPSLSLYIHLSLHIYIYRTLPLIASPTLPLVGYLSVSVSPVFLPFPPSLFEGHLSLSLFPSLLFFLSPSLSLFLPPSLPVPRSSSGSGSLKPCDALHQVCNVFSPATFKCTFRRVCDMYGCLG